MKNRSKIRKRRILILFVVIIIGVIAAVCIFEKRAANLAAEKKNNEIIAEKQKIELKKKKEAELKKKAEEAAIEAAVSGNGTSDNIPILMYHSIKYEKGNELRIPKEKFAQQMQYLKDAGFHPVSLDELYSYYVFGNELPQKPILITLDDGYLDNYTNAYPVLKDMGFKATIFMITDSINDKSDYLAADQLQEMDKNGIDIECHTVTHRHLGDLSYDEQKKELEDSKTALEKVLGRKVNYIAYPFGSYNQDTLNLVVQLGYKMAVTTEEGKSNKSNGIYKLKRVYISNNFSLDYFKKLVN